MNQGKMLVIMLAAGLFFGTGSAVATWGFTNQAPVADAGGPYVGHEGSPMTFDASESYDRESDVLRFRWDFENDGVWDTSWSYSSLANHTWGDDYLATLKVEVYDGESYDADTSTVRVKNVAPTIEVGHQYSGDESSEIVFVASVTDPGSDDLNVTWKWDDGTSQTETIYYNNGMDPDPSPSPGGTYPFSVTDTTTHIYGDNGVFNVTLSVTDDDGGSVAYRPAQDIVFVIDSSLSMMWNDPNDDRVEAAKMYVDEMSNPDRGAVVDFDHMARLVNGHHLSTDLNQVRNDIDTIDSMGFTNIYDAIRIANDELIAYGDPDHAHIEILLTDGNDTTGHTRLEILSEANRASDNSIVIYTIGLGEDVDAELLMDIAYVTGGEYYDAPHPENLYEIYQGIFEEVRVNVSITVVVDNVSPSVHLDGPYFGDEEPPITFEGVSTDPGSDDLTFTWDWGDGTSESHPVYYNNGLSPDPYPSPEINPMSVVDTAAHTYQHSGTFTITLTVMDDDGGVNRDDITITLPEANLPPIADAGDDQRVFEGDVVFFDGSGSVGVDASIVSYEWDFDAGVDSDGDGDPRNDVDATGPTSSHAYGDDGTYVVTLKVADSYGAEDVASVNVTVLNVDPSIESITYSAFYNVPRTQGYWNHQCRCENPRSADHVGIQDEFIQYIVANSEVFADLSTKEEVCDILGKADENDMSQKAKLQLMALWLNVASGKLSLVSPVMLPPMNLSTTLQGTIEIIEEIIINDDEERMEWGKDIADAINNGDLVPIAMVTFTATASDPGSDDLTFEWDLGDGTGTTHVYYNNGVGPDPPMSPDLNPRIVKDELTHAYSAMGDYVVTLTVMDDDSGIAESSMILELNPEMAESEKNVEESLAIGMSEISLQLPLCVLPANAEKSLISTFPSVEMHLLEFPNEVREDCLPPLILRVMVCKDHEIIEVGIGGTSVMER